jgi:hypothetical protein
MEAHLIPKEWAIRLADEIHGSPTQGHFLKSVVKEKYRDWPWVRPFFKLAEQAEARYPGKTPKDIRARNQLNRKLRTEFHALKKLIADVNETTLRKAETNGLKAALKLSTLHTLILEEAFTRAARKAVAWVEGHKATDATEERNDLLNELAAYGEMKVVETPSNNRFGRDLCLRSPLIEGWADEVIMLIIDVFAHKAALEAVEEKYFDCHPILFRDVEVKTLSRRSTNT